MVVGYDSVGNPVERPMDYFESLQRSDSIDVLRVAFEVLNATR